MSDESTHQEPFLISVAAESANAASARDESKDDGPDQPLASTERRGSTLRRRFRRRPPPTSDPEPEGKREESKYDIESAESQHPEEKKDDDEVGTPSKSPRLLAPLALAPVDDAPANEAEQRKTNPLFSLRASLPSMMRRDQAAEEKKTPPRPPLKASLPVIQKDAEEKKTPPRPSFNVSQPTMYHSTSYIRQPDEKLREKLKTRLRSVADGIPEVHFIGEVVSGTGFKDTFVSCKWSLEWGKSWSFLAGDESSQTQYSAQDDDGVQMWNHPLDAHFAAASIQGWPRIILQVWELDEYGRSILSGYGFAHLPTNPGCHELEVRCWRPSGSMREELESFFLGTSSCLVDENVIFSKAWENRSSLVTVSSGIVRMHVNVLLRFFDEQRVA